MGELLGSDGLLTEQHSATISHSPSLSPTLPPPHLFLSLSFTTGALTSLEIQLVLHLLVQCVVVLDLLGLVRIVVLVLILWGVQQLMSWATSSTWLMMMDKVSTCYYVCNHIV